MPIFHVRASHPQKRKAIGETLQDLRCAENQGAGSSHFQREGHPIQQQHDPLDHRSIGGEVGAYGSGALHEKTDRVRARQGLQRYLPLSFYLEPAPRSDQTDQGRNRGRQLCYPMPCLQKKLLEIVEDEKRRGPRKPRLELIPEGDRRFAWGVQRLQDRLSDLLHGGDGRERHEIDCSVRSRASELGGETGLPHSSRPGKRDQTRPGCQRLLNMVDLALPTEERIRPVGQRPWWRRRPSPSTIPPDVRHKRCRLRIRFKPQFRQSFQARVVEAQTVLGTSFRSESSQQLAQNRFVGGIDRQQSSPIRFAAPRFQEMKRQRLQTQPLQIQPGQIEARKKRASVVVRIPRAFQFQHIGAYLHLHVIAIGGERFFRE